MDPRTVGLIGGIGGGVLGLLGGVVGTYFSIKNTAGPRERAFVIKMAALTWAVVTMFLIALWWIPPDYRIWLFLPYLVGLGPAIRVANRRQDEIRRQESSPVGSEPTDGSSGR